MAEQATAPAYTRGQYTYALVVLFAINFMNFYDRQVVGAVGEKIKQEWQLSDGQLASLTTAFVLLYAVVGIPLGRLADTGQRRVILARGIAVWSACTALSGAAGSYLTHFLSRMGVGVGEASCAPTANSLIGDLFPPSWRARAISIFMLGLPLGLGASYLISGMVVQATGGWRPALYVAAAPGAVLAVLALFLPEPPRAAVAASAPALDSLWGSIRSIVRIPTMRWIIASGAALNLVMYALGAFSTSLFIRYHGIDIAEANQFNAMIFGLGGGLGMLLGGWLGDRVATHGPAGRLRLSAVGCAIAAPLQWWALQQPRGSAWPFALCMTAATIAIYLYYSTVYATIHDLVSPRVRGMAMSVYFFVFYLFTALGLVVFGRLSDRMAASALSAGATAAESRALGLHQAMYAMPVMCVALVGILVMAAHRAARDTVRGTGA